MSSEPTIETITCLSVQQPYADDIFFAGKWAENRSWRTNYRGELWIHSSRRATSIVAERTALGCEPEARSPTGLLTGHILGRVNLIECVTSDVLFSSASKAACKAMAQRPEDQMPVSEGDQETVEFLRRLLDGIDPDTWNHFYFEAYAWIFGEPQMLESPIPVGGKLNLWKMDVPTARLQMARKGKRRWTPDVQVASTPIPK